jgi:hypothetical protein
MKKSSLALILFVVIVFGLGLFGYYKMGGFSKAEVRFLQNKTFVIIGKEVDMRADSKEYKAIFARFDSLIARQQLDTKTAAYYYNEPKRNENYQVKAFIGFLQPEDSFQKPDSLKKRSFQFKKVYKGSHKANLIVNSTYEAIIKQAQADGNELKGEESLEIYLPKQKVVIYRPLKE